MRILNQYAANNLFTTEIGSMGIFWKRDLGLRRLSYERK
jgi:hypothetical protein